MNPGLSVFDLSPSQWNAHWHLTAGDRPDAFAMLQGPLGMGM